jgi:hypothetical protein
MATEEIIEEEEEGGGGGRRGSTFYMYSTYMCPLLVQF